MSKDQGTLLGHPKGLFLLFGTELWERFCFYGMRAILVLYLTEKTMNGGFGWTTKDALSLYATYTGLVYLTPLIGGWIADNFLGQRRCVMIGGVAMAAAQFVLALPNSVVGDSALHVFYAGLTLMIIGNGLFKANISTMVGDLYEEGDNRRDGAFTIFYMGINLGSLLAGIIAGTAVSIWGYKAGFATAGIGICIGLTLQMLFARRLLGRIGIEPAAKRDAAKNKSGKKEPLTKVERDRLKVIMIMGLFVVVFWAGFEQAGGLMNIYTQQYTDRVIGSFTVPTEWFQSLNPFFIITLAPVIAALWVKMGPKEPSSPIKFALALFFLAIGFLFMVGAAMEQGGDLTVKTSMLWLVGAYFFHTLGELCLSPIGLSMVTKLAPLRLCSLLMGVWFSFNALANYLAGIIGSHIGDAGALAIFGGIASAATVSGLILILFSGKLIDWMHGAEGQPTTEMKEAEAQLAEAN
ncbi:peptide MFS transporter [Photobacterium leiognathi]|uniref:peptide MFS transporter n=1 Tax=Photobacterium leiognathi TaxID=553611 RepID=UPI002981276A|nr:peptide MFS transporter [Photobacterium leiognathi]